MFKQATDLLGLKPKILTSLAVSLSVLFHCPSVWACPWNSGSSLSYSSVLRADGVLFRVRFTPLKLGGEPAFLSAFLAALSKVSGSTHVLLPLRERPTPQCVSRRGFQRPHQVVRGQREAPADVGHSLLRPPLQESTRTVPPAPTTETAAPEAKQVPSSVSYACVCPYVPLTIFFPMMIYHRILNAVLWPCLSVLYVEAYIC